jgi:O-acetyl-ADP-ribose deacetylase (regulator of RNase III)
MKIEVRQGDITEQPDLDALVAPANTELIIGAGIAGLVSTRGGPTIAREAAARAPIELGEVVPTSAGALVARYVLHAAVVGYREEDSLVPRREGSLSSVPIVFHAMTGCLRLAEQLGCRAIGLPPLGEGMALLPIEEATDGMLGAIDEYAQAVPASKIERVVFVLFRRSDCDVVRSAVAAREEEQRRLAAEAAARDARPNARRA